MGRIDQNAMAMGGQEINGTRWIFGGNNTTKTRNWPPEQDMNEEVDCEQVQDQGTAVKVEGVVRYKVRSWFRLRAAADAGRDASTFI